MKCKGLSLLSGGLDSQLAIRVLERAGAYVEAVAFETPFFSSVKARNGKDRPRSFTGHSRPGLLQRE